MAAAVLFSACSSTDKPLAPRSSAPLNSSSSDVTLSFVSFQPPKSARVRLTNASSRTITWEGYESTPWYRVRQRDVFGWHEREVGWFCGKGLDIRRLGAGQSIEFDVDLPKHDLRVIQVGNDYTVPPGKEKLTVWSTPFSPRP